MDENMVLEKLTQFGLTRQEANIYLCLYRNGEMSGYEVAKYTGISRSNVYSGLSDLTEKGAAYLMESNVNRYVAVPIAEFCDNKIRTLNSVRDELVAHIPVVKQETSGYITVEGYVNIRNKMLTMLETAEKRVYISAKSEYVGLFQEELEALVRKNIKVVIITDGTVTSPVLNEKAIIYFGEDRKNIIHLIVDSQFAISGEVNQQKEDTCLYTGQENFIHVFKEMLRNEMKLIEIDRKGNA